MRIEQPTRRGINEPWLVYAQPGEFYDNTEDVLLGEVTPRGGLSVVKRRFRGDQLRSARLRLDDARRVLVSGGHIRDRALERAILNEAQTGSFIVELDNGEERRFHTLAPEPARRTTAPRYDRPSAWEWASEALLSGRATHADLFRHSSSNDPRRAEIFHPHILPARDEHPPMVVGEHEQLPVTSWSMRDGFSFPRQTRSRDVQRAYEAKKHAMDLAIDRHLRGFSSEYRAWRHRGSPQDELHVPLPTPAEIADAWEVTEDAFLEAHLPLQVDFARANFRYWRDAATRDAAARKGLKRYG